MKKFLLTLVTLFFSFSLVSANLLGAGSGVEIRGPNKIQKEQYQILTLSDILSFYTSDAAMTVSEDNYSGNGAVLGVHTIVLFATDGVETKEKTVEIEVIKSIGYGVRAVTNLKDIHIAKSNVLLPQDIVQIHNRTGVFALNQTSQMSILTDNYTTFSEVPGTYVFEYRIMDATGLDQVISCNITVYDSERLQTPVIVIPKTPSSFDLVKKVLVNSASVIIIIIVAFFLFKMVRKARKS